MVDGEGDGWSVRVMLEAIKEYKKPPPPPPPQDRVKTIEEEIIDQDADPITIIQQNIDDFGPLKPSEANTLAVARNRCGRGTVRSCSTGPRTI